MKRGPPFESKKNQPDFFFGLEFDKNFSPPSRIFLLYIRDSYNVQKREEGQRKEERRDFEFSLSLTQLKCHFQRKKALFPVSKETSCIPLSLSLSLCQVFSLRPSLFSRTREKRERSLRCSSSLLFFSPLLLVNSCLNIPSVKNSSCLCCKYNRDWDRKNWRERIEGKESKWSNIINICRE